MSENTAIEVLEQAHDATSTEEAAALYAEAADLFSAEGNIWEAENCEHMVDVLNGGTG